MEVTRKKTEQSGAVAAPTHTRRTISDQAAQVLASVITIAIFSGIAGALHLMFERMAAS